MCHWCPCVTKEICSGVTQPGWVNTLRPRQNGRHFADDIFKLIFVNENIWIPIKISLKFVPKGSINNIPALVQIMAWRRPGDKPLSEPMMVSLTTHICVTRPQWVNIGLSRILHHWHTSGKYKMKMQMSIHKCRWKTLNFSSILAQNYKQFLSSLAHQFTSLLVHQDITQPQWGLMVHKWIA